MKTRLAIAILGAVLAGGSVTTHASDGRDRHWGGHGSRHHGWGHDTRHYHHEWRPAPRWHRPGPAYRGYGAYPPPHARGHDGVTIILRGRLY